MNREKVIFIIQGLIRGGAENFFINLVNKLEHQGIQPVVIILSDKIPLIEEIAPSIKTYVLSRNFRYDLLISKRIKKIILQENAKKVFCVGAFTFFLSKLSMLRQSEYTFYLSLHTTVPVSVKEHILDMLYLKFLTKTDEAIFICHSQQEYYKHHYLFNPTRTSVIYNGIDSDFSLSQGSSDGIVVRGELGIPANAKVILKVANIRPEKGHMYAIEALSILHQQYNCKAHLVFVGGGAEEYCQKLLAQASQLRLADYIHLVGAQTNVKPFLEAADIFTLTSYSVETFSIAALEAMAFGLPCCLTNIGGAKEMVEEHKTGLLSVPRDASSIAKAWHELLNRIYESSYIKGFLSSKFSLDKMVNNYHAVLQPTGSNNRQ